MAVKKAGKSVLDYDPLSWLKGEETDNEDKDISEQAAAQQDAKEQTVSSEAAEEKETEQAKVRGDESVQEASVEETIAADAKVEIEPQSLHSTGDEPEAVEAAGTSDDYYVLDTELTMKNVAEVKQQLDKIMQADTPVSIDADALRKIDSAGLQMLYSMQKSLKKNGASINWKQDSEVIKTAAAIIAMDFETVPDQKSIAEIEAEQGFGFF